MNDQKIQELEQKVKHIVEKQHYFSNEIKQILLEIEALKKENIITNKPEIIPSQDIRTPYQQNKISELSSIVPKKKTLQLSFTNFEKLIGENWINKLGIFILIIGVIIGAKYSIENNLISPLTRIILGYFTGIGLLSFGLKLKEKYENYSSVLVGGAMAIFYFITFFAYNFYDLIPYALAFALMVIFTFFSVISAIYYNRVAIAHIGLVGAYAIPFLLSDNSGRINLLFSYITLINIGIFYISIKKLWNSLYHSAFIFTWLIFISWFWNYFFTNYDYYNISTFCFASLFFLIFYAMFIISRIIQKENIEKVNIIFLLLNSFIYFGIGFSIINYDYQYSYLLGFFTLLNAIIHLGVVLIIKQKQLVDTPIFHLILGLVFTFITIAIPIQLEGNWITLFWAILGCILFGLGRTKNLPFYEKTSYPILILTFISLCIDWTILSYLEDIAFWNPIFLTSLIAIVGFSFISYLIHKYTEQNKISKLFKTFSFIIPSLLFIISYFTFIHEINLYFSKWYYNSFTKLSSDDSILTLNNITLIIYSLIFFGVVSLINFYKIKNNIIYRFCLVSSCIILFYTLTYGILEIKDLRNYYINREANPYYSINIGYIFIQYIVWIAISFLILGIYKNFKLFSNENKKIYILLEGIIQVSILAFLSNELITWLNIMEYQHILKLSLSILWGLYALIIVYLGILKQKFHFRIMAMGLFGITLIKVFFYDISHLDTINKTLVFIILGVILLTISFLYNKFKNKISDNDKL